MPFATRFYVPRMERAKSDTNVGYFANKAHAALDYNPDSYETALATSPLIIQIDADATKTGTTIDDQITWAGLWIKNYSASWGAAYVNVNSGASYGSTATRTVIQFSWLSGSSGLILNTMAPRTDRYWQFDFGGLTILPQISMVMLGGYYDVVPRWDWGHTRGRRNMNIVTDTPDGRMISRNQRSEAPETFVRSYQYLDQTNRDILNAAHTAALGRHVPVVIVDDNATAMSAHRLVRFAVDELDQQEIEYQLHNVAVPMIEVPYTRAGRVF